MRSKLKTVLLALCLFLIPLSSHGDTSESPVASFEILERIDAALADWLQWLSTSTLSGGEATQMESGAEMEKEPIGSSVSEVDAEEAEEPTTQEIYGYVVPDG